MENNTKKEIKKEIKKSIVRKKFDGIVISDKMNKTIVVKVNSVKIHPKYKKRYTISKKYNVHDEKNNFKEGDKIMFTECRPISKNKKWRALYK